ncbi:hypothetical protein ACFQVA_10155 [Actinomadura keratinilytica]
MGAAAPAALGLGMAAARAEAGRHPAAPAPGRDIFGGVFATMRRYPGGLFGVAAVLHGGYLVVAAGALFAGYLTQRETIDRLLDSSAARPPRGSELTSVLLSFGLIWFLVVALGLVVNAVVAVACTTVTREAVLGGPPGSDRSSGRSSASRPSWASSC